MKSEIFAVYDAAVQAYHQPFFSPTKGAAVRALSDALQDPASTFAKHAEDYTLFILGTWDDTDGSIECHPPEPILGLASLVLKIVK